MHHVAKLQERPRLRPHDMHHYGSQRHQGQHRETELELWAHGISSPLMMDANRGNLSWAMT